VVEEKVKRSKGHLLRDVGARILRDVHNKVNNSARAIGSKDKGTRRKGKRYAKTNPVFVWMVLKEWLKL
jgi:ribosomal protein L36